MGLIQEEPIPPQSNRLVQEHTQVQADETPNKPKTLLIPKFQARYHYLSGKKSKDLKFKTIEAKERKMTRM